jgi:uncharacterized protein (TIGR03435 family)
MIGQDIGSYRIVALLDTDGFRCLWGQSIDARGKLVDQPVPIRHCHRTMAQEFSKEAVHLAHRSEFILLYAFHLIDHELAGAPDRVKTSRYNITGVYTSSGPLNEDDVRGTVQTLLKDRFGLAVHREMRELPVYALTVVRADGKLGAQLKPSQMDCAGKQAQMVGGGASPVTPTHERPRVRHDCGLSNHQR